MKRNLQLFLTLILFTAVNAAHANTPDPAVEKEPDWEGSIAAGFSLTEGNSDTSLFTLESQLEKVEGTDQWRFKLGGRYGSSEGSKDNQLATGEAQYRHELSERWYASAELLGEHDDIAELDYRFSGGPAVGFFFIRSKKTRLLAESGPLYVVERQGGEKDEFAAWQVVQRFRIQITKTAKIVQSLRTVVSLENAEDSLFRATLGLETAVTDHIALAVTLEDRYQNIPAEDAERNDFSLITSLKYSF